MDAFEVAVIDASLVVEALVPARGTEEARRVLLELAGRAAMLVPQGLFHAEVLSGLRRAFLRGAVRSLTPLVEALYAMPLHPVEVSKSLLLAAAEVSVRAGCGAPDAIYIALALATNARLYTVDAGQAAAAKKLLGGDRVVYVAA